MSISSVNQNKVNLEPFTLSFQDNREEAFLKDYFNRSINHVRIALLLAGFFYGVFGVLDAWLVPEVKEKLWFIRYVIFIPLVLSVFLFSFSPYFKRLIQPMIASVVLVAGLGIIAMIYIAPYPGANSYYAGLILVFVFGYTFFKLRFIWASLAAWLIVIAYEIVAIRFINTPLPILMNNNFFFLAGNIIGMFACYCIELSARNDFNLARKLDAERNNVKIANRELEKRVKDRTAQVLSVNEDLKQEISVRKIAEKSLYESEQRFRSLSENCPEIIYTLSYDGSFTYVNPAWEESLGHPAIEVIGKYFIDFCIKEDAKTYVSLFKRIRDDGRTLKDVTGKLLDKDGSIRTFSFSGAPNFDNEGRIKGMVGFLKDMTEQQRLQSELIQAQKMEAIGTLAGGIAHDFNNLLQAILGYADLLLLNKTDQDDNYNELTEMKLAGERGADLARQLLLFSRKVRSELRPTNVNHQLKSIHRLLQRTIPKMIDIELNTEKNLKTINADPAQIEQILLNLAVNAKDAMPDGGNLIIETKNVILDEDFCQQNKGMTPGDYVIISVSDTGHGIEPANQDKIFEPFFTTKENGKGTGLGLSMVYGIIKSHGGFIKCDSILGRGTTFKIYVPAIAQEAELIKENDCEQIPIAGHETIMLVDDDWNIRDLGAKILTQCGYNVLTASDGESAIELYREKNGQIDLFVLDLIMPGIGGKRCLEELIKIDPNINILISSGFFIDDSMKKSIESHARGFIKKPWDTKQMLRAINDCIH